MVQLLIEHHKQSGGEYEKRQGGSKVEVKGQPDCGLRKIGVRRVRVVCLHGKGAFKELERRLVWIIMDMINNMDLNMKENIYDYSDYMNVVVSQSTGTLPTWVIYNTRT